MAFLDNSGDIILDAVLTDTGRLRLARGDGSFRIAKFALGDDEINYGLYDKGNASGSAYYDLEILQTPVLEAFTNNTSFLKSKLMTIARTNLLYLPIMEINEKQAGREMNSVLQTWVVAADNNTLTPLATAGHAAVGNIIEGASPNPQLSIWLDQGLDTTEIPSGFALDPDLIENQYIIEIDNRLGQITNAAGGVQSVSFIDDDSIASYYISQVGGNMITSLPGGTDASDADSPITGPRGTRLIFSLKSSVELQSSEFLFDRLGSTDTTSALATAVKDGGDGGTSYTGLKYIDTTVRITGGQTGYRIDVPVRFVKVYNA
jgi:hypothetical protein